MAFCYVAGSHPSNLHTEAVEPKGDTTTGKV